MDRRQTLGMLLCSALCFLPSVTARATDEPKEVESYMLLEDTVVAVDKKMEDTVFFTSDEKAAAAKMKELGSKFPDNITFHGAGLFAIVISSHDKEGFLKVTEVKSSHTAIVNLETDEKLKAEAGEDPAGEEEAEKPKEPGEGKKNSRLLLITCSAIPGLKNWALKGADGKQAAIKSVELKGDQGAREKEIAGPALEEDPT